MKKISLTQGKFALVDDEDFEYLNQWKWYYGMGNPNGYARRDCWDKITKRKYPIFMHREILKTPKGLFTDHIDGDGLNNTRNNLRICTGLENHRNRKKGRRGNSKYKGVYWKKERKKWQASIRVNYRHVHLGTHSNEFLAAKAYDKGAIKYHGKFACLNFSEEV